MTMKNEHMAKLDFNDISRNNKYAFKDVEHYIRTVSQSVVCCALNNESFESNRSWIKVIAIDQTQAVVPPTRNRVDPFWSKATFSTQFTQGQHHLRLHQIVLFSCFRQLNFNCLHNGESHFGINWFVIIIFELKKIYINKFILSLIRKLIALQLHCRIIRLFIWNRMAVHWNQHIDYFFLF